VWITGADGTYVFTTGANAWKTKRLRRNASVEVRACNMRGRVSPEAVRYGGTGKVDSSVEVIAAAERALAAKYGWQFRATQLVDRLKVRLGRGDPQVPIAIELSLEKG
jgi:PPOX class probable F420-dependent enzyme